MADVYGVIAADVAAELPELFPTGFSASTRPTTSQVTKWISVADTVVWLRVFAVTEVVPTAADVAAVLARQYIIEWVKGKVYEAIYAGRATTEVNAATKPSFAAAAALLTAIEDLGLQATGEGTDVSGPFDPNAWSTIKSLRQPLPSVGTGELGTLT